MVVGVAALVGPVQQIAAGGEPAVVQHPADRRPGVRLQPPRERRLSGLLGVRAEQHQEERGGVDRAVVPPVGDLAEVGQFAVAHLVDDPAGPGRRVGRVRVVRGLGRGQRQQGGRRRGRAVRQHEERGQQGVAAEERRVPGDTGARYEQRLALRPGRLHLEQRQFGQAPVGGGREGRFGGGEPDARAVLLDAPRPPGHRVRHGGRGRPGRRGVTGQRLHPHGQHRLPGRVRVERPDQPPGPGPGLLHRLGGGRGGDPRTGQPAASPVAELHAVVQEFTAPLERGLDVGAVVGAQLEEVGEVRVDGERDPQRRRRRGVPHHPQPVDETPVAQRLLPEDGVRGRLARPRPGRQHAPQRLLAGGRDQHVRRGPVQRQLPPAEMPRVPHEQPLRHGPPAGHHRLPLVPERGERAPVHQQMMVSPVHGMALP
ncbi:hypothetical protein GA0115250_118912 [Streptomyces sp. BvitLS-983]|nr:hypothetical protein GA0115250_118912 [Streptomyces sp. BvitLS-983]